MRRLYEHTHTHTAAFHYIENEYTATHALAHKPCQFRQCCFYNVFFLFSLLIIIILRSFLYHDLVIGLNTQHNPFIHRVREWERETKVVIVYFVRCVHTKAHIGARQHSNKWSWSIIHGIRIGYLCTKVSKLSHANLNPSHPHH